MGEGLTGLEITLGGLGWAEKGGGWCLGTRLGRVFKGVFGQGEGRGGFHFHDGDDLVHLLATGTAVAVGDEAGCWFMGLFGVPDGRESLLTGKEITPSLDVVVIPEEELETFGIVLDVNQVVHEVVE